MVLQILRANQWRLVPCHDAWEGHHFKRHITEDKHTYLVLNVGQVALQLLNSTTQFLHVGLVLFRPATCVIKLSTAVL